MTETFVSDVPAEAVGNNFGTRNDPPTGNNFDAAAPSATQQEERNGEKSDENK